MRSDLEHLRGNLDLIHEFVEIEYIDDPNSPEPSDMSYLSADDRANPDVMSNVDAMNAMDEYIAWFGRDGDGGWFGLWCGTAGGPVSDAPIVHLDSEGQYQLTARSVGDLVVITVYDETGDDEEFARVRSSLTEAGFRVSESAEKIYESLRGVENPGDVHSRLYNEGRKRRGLNPVE